jgi:hypothetical protein
MIIFHVIKNIPFLSNEGSHGGDFEDDSLLGYNAV